MSHFKLQMLQKSLHRAFEPLQKQVKRYIALKLINTKLCDQLFSEF